MNVKVANRPPRSQEYDKINILTLAGLTSGADFHCVRTRLAPVQSHQRTFLHPRHSNAHLAGCSRRNGLVAWLDRTQRLDRAITITTMLVVTTIMPIGPAHG